MTRKQRLAAKHAAGRGKGRPTPKQPTGGRTRAQATAALSRKAQRELAGAPSAIDRAQEMLRFAKDDDRKLMERMLQQAGGIVLPGRSKR